MTRCSEPRDLIYGLLNIAKDTVETPDVIIPDYCNSIETLFWQTMSACLYAHDRIPCLKFCDTLATRLDLNLERVLECANEMLGSSPAKSSIQLVLCEAHPIWTPCLSVSRQRDSSAGKFKHTSCINTILPGKYRSPTPWHEISPPDVDFPYPGSNRYDLSSRLCKPVPAYTQLGLHMSTDTPQSK